jgi:hypothetical protein
MSSASLSSFHPSGAMRPLAGLLAREPLFAASGLLLLFLMVPTGFAALVDARVLDGANVWAKPLKFQFALGVYLLTLAFFARFMPASVLAGRPYRLFAVAVVIAVWSEVVWIGTAAGMGMASHFNPGAFGQVIYPIMGALAVLLTTATAVYAWNIARNPQIELSPAVRQGLVIGLAMVLPLTLLTAGTMANLGSHLVGVGASGASLPVFGWSLEAGDLRVSHFFATHAMHFVPAFAVASAWLAGRDAVWPVRAFAILFAALTIFTFVQALMGRPFLPAIG